jgi:hypothetical protein
VEGIANGGGADGEGVASGGRHEPRGVSKDLLSRRRGDTEGKKKSPRRE